jgi:hypothetical protein
MLERNREKERTQMAAPLPTQVMGREELVERKGITI